MFILQSTIVCDAFLLYGRAYERQSDHTKLQAGTPYFRHYLSH